MLFTSRRLGEVLQIDNIEEQVKYYDLTIPTNSTIVLGACSGNDTVLEEIFGNLEFQQTGDTVSNETKESNTHSELDDLTVNTSLLGVGSNS
ncbi:MAG: hypothetical protein KA998_01175 [Rickettsiaceae bacterium]|nr:hypothetical protein [Rickettsiaceae bacterium]